MFCKLSLYKVQTTLIWKLKKKSTDLRNKKKDLNVRPRIHFYSKCRIRNCLDPEHYLELVHVVTQPLKRLQRISYKYICIKYWIGHRALLVVGLSEEEENMTSQLVMMQVIVPWHPLFLFRNLKKKKSTSASVAATDCGLLQDPDCSFCKSESGI